MIWKLTLATGILGAAAILGAQAPGQQPPADRPANQPTVEGNKATISGCLKPGASPGSFILTNAATVPAAPGGDAAPATGTTGSTKSYNIVAKSAEDISKHVNHKIEVTGALSKSQPGAAPPAADQPVETVTVQSFKMVAMACP